MKKLQIEGSKEIMFIYRYRGISMSGLADIIHKRLYRFRFGYKADPPDRQLGKQGARIYIGHDPYNIGQANWVVYAIAVREDNPELMAAGERGIPVIERAELLGHIMETYPYSIGVAGSHGKTTTTSMLSIIMQNAHLDPTILVGGELDDIGGNVKIGSSRYFITEACEYNESFLHFEPYIAIILNIDEDHLDYFKNLQGIYEALRNTPALSPIGMVIGCMDDPLVPNFRIAPEGLDLP